MTLIAKPKDIEPFINKVSRKYTYIMITQKKNAAKQKIVFMVSYAVMFKMMIHKNDWEFTVGKPGTGFTLS